MSRIGLKPIPLPESVKVVVGPANHVNVTGPQGTLERQLHPAMYITVEDGVAKVNRPSDESKHRALHGLTRALLNNMVIGVSEGYERTLDLVGTGYRTQQSGEGIVLNVGYSHTVVFAPLPGVSVTAESATRIRVAGCDKQAVGEAAAQIRAVRPPDSYKGKGIRYTGEVVRLKPGKAAARKS